jgi:intergrase/recombinase
LNWQIFRQWVKSKYAKSYAPSVYCYAFKFHGLLNGNLAELEAFGKSKRGTILRALVALSKYLGVYPQFKQRMKEYGLKWEGYDGFDSVVRMMKDKSFDTLKWVKNCISVFDKTYRTLVLFALISGMRRSEVINSFNLIIKLGRQVKLGEYYNDEMHILEHFKYKQTFLRGKKNVYFSFIPKDFINKIPQCKTVSISGFKRRKTKNGFSSQFHAIRDYYATFMIQHGLLQQEVDVLQGRIGRSMFMKHYFSPDLKDLENRTLNAVQQMLSEVNT